MLVCTFAITGFLQAQAPLSFNYQGVARNNFGTVINNKTISIRFSVRDLTSTGTVVYSERHTISTDQYGVFALRVGAGTLISGAMNTVNWAVGNKFLQVEMDPNGGTSFLDMGTLQLNSVPYSIIAGGAPPIGPAGGDLLGSTYPNPIIAPLVVTTGKLADASVTTVKIADLNVTTAKIADGAVTTQKITFPLIKTQSEAANPLLGMTNSSATGTAGAVSGASASTDGNATAVTGTMSSTTPGGFSSGVRGINNGTSGLGIGVYGSQAGSGWGVYGTTPSGIGVHGNSASGFGVYGLSNSGAGVYGSSTTGNGGLFEVTNAASTADALRATTAGTGASWAIRGISSGTNGAGLFQQTNATNTSNNLQSNQAGLGRAGLFNSTNAASTANAVDINVAGTGFALRAASSNAAPKALLTAGGVQLTGIGEAAGRVLISDATGNATWQAVGGSGAVTGSGTLNFVPKWTPSGTQLGNSLMFDDGNSVGVGTTTPTHRFNVSHGGSTGIGVTSTSGFSVVDIDAASGDAALRFAKAGVNQWNIRNRPADDYLEIFELGGGGSRMVIQDATGNVGIGETANPTYKLDVLHGGSTGIRSRSSGSFSVVDIDAASGDAALRFAKAGVNQWNTRNRPADDYYEIFELGGGGSRFVIQDATGNVGIGETANPTYKLDVLHGGSTGIRSRSSSSFSVVDIDAQSGDAALRFAKAGVNQWNIRNRPADDYLEIFELGGGGSRVVIQDGTGNVGIGETTAPAYKLDVLHGGSTGIRSRSESSFSVVDIDAASGDAALRFAKAGVNQWNTRNRPADDYYEIFELGGGGSRFVIQDGTGNVGIGETTAPSYKLDVLHGGSTGIRSRSSSSFSVVDIDGQSGDAALRFAKAGVNQWNTRNNPGTDDYQIFELGGGGERMRIDNTTGKVWVNQDFTVVGVKAFTMDHPLDPTNKTLMHAAIESNEVMNMYSGNVVTDANGKATVSLPDYYEALNKDSRYQLTVIGSFAQAIISKKINNNKFEIATSQPNIEVSWEVKGVRNDKHMQKFPFVAVEEKSAAQKGRYIDPAAYNQPESKRVSYSNVEGSSLEDINPALKQVKAAPATTGGSLDQQKIVPPVTANTVEKGGSTEEVKAVVTQKKVLPVDGSVKPQEPKKEETKAPAKPAENTGSTKD